MTDGIRISDLGVASHRRLVYRNIMSALKTVFDDDYDRERQLKNIKITQQYPYRKLDYPCIVVEYQNSTVLNAGVGHYEYFPDPYGRLRKWHHRRFEGMIHFNVFALSTPDRDILTDAITELISFGTLEPILNRFYEIIYPTDFPIVDPGDGSYALDYSLSMLSQLMFNSDEIRNSGDSATIAAWQPEDVLVYSSGIFTDLHGGFYNTNPTVDLSRVTRILIDAYQTDQSLIDLPFPGHAEIAWEPPFVYSSSDEVGGEAVISAEEYMDNEIAQVFNDSARIKGYGEIFAAETFEDAP